MISEEEWPVLEQDDGEVPTFPLRRITLSLALCVAIWVLLLLALKTWPLMWYCFGAAVVLAFAVFALCLRDDSVCDRA